MFGPICGSASRQPKRFSILFVACAACLWSHLVWAGNFETVTYQNILFMQLPAGSFTMGTSDSEQSMLEGQKNWTRFEKGERPRRVVTLTKPFLIGKYEITQKQWRQVTGKNPSAFKGTNSLPVESVSWEEVQEFIKKLNEQGDGKFRLPTEAEWEYACRARIGLMGSSTARRRRKTRSTSSQGSNG